MSSLQLRPIRARIETPRHAPQQRASLRGDFVKIAKAIYAFNKNGIFPLGVKINLNLVLKRLYKNLKLKHISFMLNFICTYLAPYWGFIKFLAWVIPFAITAWFAFLYFCRGGKLIYRLGHGLNNRKIGLVTMKQDSKNIHTMLLSSDLFKCKNIIRIDHTNLNMAKTIDLLIIDWNDLTNEPLFEADGKTAAIQQGRQDVCNDLLLHVRSNVAVIIISAGSGEIYREYFNSLANKQNVSVTNSKGRLMNDVITAMITTSYQAK